MGVPESILEQISRLLKRLESGEINLAQAEMDASALGAAVGADAADMLVKIAVQAADLAQEGARKRGLNVVLLARAAAAGIAPRSPEAEHASIQAAANLVEVAHQVFRGYPDPALLELARVSGEDAAQQAADLGWPWLQGLILFRLGTMLLDPYTTDRWPPPAYDYQHNLWLENAGNQGNPQLRSLLSSSLTTDADGRLMSTPPAFDMPTPTDALLAAEKYLRRALPLVSVDRRWRVLKALSQTLEWQGYLGLEVDRSDLLRISQEALAAIPQENLQARLAVEATLANLGVPTGQAADVQVLELDFAGFVAAHGERHAWEVAGKAAALLSSDDPDRALRLLLLRRNLQEPWEDGDLLNSHYELELTLLARTSAPGWALQMLDHEGSVREAAQRALAEAADPPPGSTPRSLAGAYLAVMLAAGRHDQERVALDMQAARRLSTIDPALTSQHTHAVAHMLGRLYLNEGVNLLNAGDDAAAVSHYQRAIVLFLGAQLSAQALHCARRVADVLRRGHVTDVAQLALDIAGGLWVLELLGDAGAEVLQSIYRPAITVAASQGDQGETILSLVQLAKGCLTSALMTRGITGFRLGDEAERLLSRARDLERELPAGLSPLRPAAEDSLLAEDMMLVAYAGMAESTPAVTVQERLANVERAFESHLINDLVEQAGSELSLLSADRVCAAIGPQTVLLQLFSGTVLGGDEATMLSVASTATGHLVGFDQSDLPGGARTLIHEDRSLTVPLAGPVVAGLREEIQCDPYPRPVTPAAAELVDALGNYCWSPLADVLGQLRASGKDHLLIVPHGEFHVCPLHLARVGGRQLTDDWMVSYGMSLGDALRPAPPSALREPHSSLPPVSPAGVRPKSRGTRGAVFGMTYTGDLRMPTVESSRAEAAAVAEILGVSPMLDADATVAAVTRALQECRYVHIRAHGRHNVAAPFLQAVFLAPAAGGDGRLRAFEVLSMDLRGLEVVTLGACETALGRVDRSDNPRGLTAALLAAGAGAVIGTLWPVLADASTVFFTAFYQSLRNHDRPIRYAYADAQRAVRKQFPAWRDWGAFVLIGGGAGAS